MDQLLIVNCNRNFLKNSFSPSLHKEWNKLDGNLRNVKRCEIFKTFRLSSIEPSLNRFYNCHNPKDTKLLTRLLLDLDHLHYHKFKCNFQDTFSPLCNCSQSEEFLLLTFFFFAASYL